ncbi:MAG: M20/M25/M40 family metallo-hydrolase [Thermodesulfovibrionales bacterium]
MVSNIKKERLIDTFIELIKINSPSFSEKTICNHLNTLLRNCGFKTTIQDFGRSINLIGFKEGHDNTIPTLILSAHMDTVQPTEGLSYSIDDERIKSTGNTILGADDKSAIAQIIEAIRVIQETNIEHGDIEIVFTSAEEKGLIGAKSLDYASLKGKMALVIDSTGSVGRIIIAAPTHLTYELTVNGKSAHAGIEPEKGINAIRVVSEIIANIPDGRIDSVTTANVGYIRGGGETNVVPAEVTIKGEIRSHDRETLNKTIQRLKDTINDVCEKASTKYSLKESIEYESFRIDNDDAFLSIVKQAYENVGINPELAVSGGGSDANIFNHKGIKAINISNGMQSVHTNEEYILIDDLVKGASVIVEIIKTMRQYRQ